MTKYYREYYQDNKERIGEGQKIRRLENKDYVSSYQRFWRQNNREKTALYSREKYYKNNQFRLAHNLRRRLQKALKNKSTSGSAVRDLGCSVAELETHLQNHFQPGMTWQNYGRWHIDHKLPLFSFDLTDREQLLKAVHYTNLQPMWARENLEKGKKIIEVLCYPDSIV